MRHAARWIVVSIAVLALGVVVAPGVGRRWDGRADAATVLAQAQVHYRAGRFDAAAASLATLERLRPPTAMDRLARALVARARGEDALPELADPGE